MGFSDKIMIPLVATYFIMGLVFFGLSTTATLATPADPNSDDNSAIGPDPCKGKFELYGANWNAMMQLLACQITLTTIVWETKAKKLSKRRKEISLDYESFPYGFVFYFLWFATWIPAVVAMAGCVFQNKSCAA